MEKRESPPEFKVQQGFVAKYSLGKIKSKYLILDILSYAW